MKFLAENLSLVMMYQILMNALLTPITVTLMLPVPTLWGASPVPVTRDTVGMESLALVTKSFFTYF